jgi:hypothetical protein
VSFQPQYKEFPSTTQLRRTPLGYSSATGGQIVRWTPPPSPPASSPVPVPRPSPSIDWAYRTSQRWKTEELASIARKNADDLAEIAAYRRSQRAALSRAAGKVFGLAAIPFLAADVFDYLAPGVHDWLKGGWNSPGGKGLPNQPSTFAPAVGRCAALYRVRWSFRPLTGGASVDADQLTFMGPVQSAYVRIFNGAFGPRWGLFTVNSSGQETGVGSAGFFDPGNWVLVSSTIERTDGLPDNCGTVESPGGPSPIVQNPVIEPERPPIDPNRPWVAPISPSSPFRLPPSSPFSFSPPKSPLERTDSPTADPAPNPDTGTPLNPNDDLPDYEYDPEPPSPSPPLTEEDGCDPCQIKIGEKLDDILEKLEELEPAPEPEPGECPEFRFDYVRVECREGIPHLTPDYLLLTTPPPPALREYFDLLSSLAAKGCASEPVAAIPDFWQVRIGASRPQIVVTYKRGRSSTYHQIAIPHPLNTDRWTENLLGDYEKGNYSGNLRLTDNSAFIINCSSEAEARRMVARAKAIIDPAYLGEGYTEQYTQRQGSTVSVDTMTAKTASFFSTGQKNTYPDWKVKLSGQWIY